MRGQQGKCFLAYGGLQYKEEYWLLGCRGPDNVMILLYVIHKRLDTLHHQAGRASDETRPKKHRYVAGIVTVAFARKTKFDL